MIVKKGCDGMLATKVQQPIQQTDAAKLELKAMQDGRVSSIDEVRDKLNQRREERD